MSSSINKLGGATLRYLKHKDDSFFRPYHSVSDGLFRAGSVVAGPVVMTGYAALCLVSSLIDLAFSAIELFNGNINGRDGAVRHLKNSGNMLFASVLCLIGAVVSPFANLVDVIGSGVTTAMQKSEDDSSLDLESPVYL